MAYVDSFVIPVPTDKLDEYRRLAEHAATIWREHGALEYKEWIADDLGPGEITSFPRSVQVQTGETVIVAYIVYESRAHRDAVNAKVMADPRLQWDPATAPFDSQRMIFGGFESFVER